MVSMNNDALREICEEYAGHEWAPMGGGIEICMRCEAEQWVFPPQIQVTFNYSTDRNDGLV